MIKSVQLAELARSSMDRELTDEALQQRCRYIRMLARYLVLDTETEVTCAGNSNPNPARKLRWKFIVSLRGTRRRSV